MDRPDIFDRAARRRARDRAAPNYATYGFLRAAMLEGVQDRLSLVTRRFTSVLDLGCFDGAFAPPAGAHVTRSDAGPAFARAARGVQCDEDHLPFADASFDLIVSAGVLDTVNDLPGALVLARRALRPDGLFLAAFVGGDSLSRLRAAMRAGDGERPVARVHPRIDVRSAGDLLVRAGFALPVADLERLTVRYPDLLALARDLRGMAGGNILAGRQSLTRAALARAIAAFQDSADPDGRVAETFELVFLTGWAPAPSQPRPARRGSSSASLADALSRSS